MTANTTQPTRNTWQETRPIAAANKTRASRSTPAEQRQPATTTQAEKDADRWVADMMFDHYNG